MAGPLKLKASGENLVNPVEGLQQLTVEEIRNYTANVITKEYATTTSTMSLDLRITTTAPAGYTSIGTFVNSEFNVEVGDHPIDGGDFSSTTYMISEKTGVLTDNKTATPLRLTDGNEVKEYTDSDLDSEILDEVITAMVTDDANTAGQYWFSETAPAGGTWTSKGTVTDTQTDDTTVTKTLWLKTAPTTDLTSTANRTLVKNDTSGVKEFSDSDIESLTNRFRNRIAETRIGSYAFVSNTSGLTGTWQQRGETITDQRKTYSDITYTGSYTGYYTGSYTGNYTGSYSGTYIGTYSSNFNRFFGGFLNSTWTGNFTGYYTGSYSGTYSGSYSGTYTGFYTGNYTGRTLNATSQTISSRKLFLRIA